MPAIRLFAEVLAKAAGDPGHVVGVRAQVVVGLAIGVGVPLAENPVLGLDGLAEITPAGLVRLEVLLVALDAGRKLAGVSARIVARPLDVVLILPLQIRV